MVDSFSPPWQLGGFTTGSTIAGYRLAEIIGRGGMAVVFRAHDDRLNRYVALKILAPVLADDEAFRQRFIRESRAAAAVDDPNIIPVFEAGEADGVLFIAMRLVRGGNLRSLVALNGPLSPGRAEWIVSAVATALDAAHRSGLVHRDVKPANVLLETRRGRPDHVYLSDFGLSKAALGSSGLTGSGQFLGTVDYAAPEQIRGEPVDGRTDQYALGCSAFELLCGQPPFLRDQGLAAVYAHLSEPPPSLTARRTELARQVDDVFARALAKSPADRYATCQDFADAFREALGLRPYAVDDEADPGHATRRATDVVQLGAAASAEGVETTTDAVTSDPGPETTSMAPRGRLGQPKAEDEVGKVSKPEMLSQLPGDVPLRVPGEMGESPAAALPAATLPAYATADEEPAVEMVAFAELSDGASSVAAPPADEAAALVSAKQSPTKAVAADLKPADTAIKEPAASRTTRKRKLRVAGATAVKSSQLAAPIISARTDDGPAEAGANQAGPAAPEPAVAAAVLTQLAPDPAVSQANASEPAIASGSEPRTVAPASDDLPDSGGESAPPTRPAGSRRARQVAAVFAAVVILGAVAAASAALLNGGSPHPPAAPTQVTQRVGPQRYHGVVIARLWRLTGNRGSRLSVTITAHSSTGKALAVQFTEPIPPALAASLSTGLSFSPSPAKVEVAQRVVVWNLSVPAHGKVTVSYHVKVPPAGVSASRLDRWIRSYESVASRAKVLLVAAQLNSLAIKPDNVRLTAGHSRQLQLTGHMSDGTTAAGSVLSNVTWKSANTAVATVKRGKVFARSAGTTQITAQIGSVKATAVVHITGAAGASPGPTYVPSSGSSSSPTAHPTPNPTPTVTPTQLVITATPLRGQPATYRAAVVPAARRPDPARSAISGSGRSLDSPLGLSAFWHVMRWAWLGYWG